MITLEQIQERSAESIRQSGMTQSEVARQLGIKRQLITCCTKGIKMPALDTFANHCKVIDADPAYILGLRG